MYKEDLVFEWCPLGPRSRHMGLFVFWKKLKDLYAVWVPHRHEAVFYNNADYGSPDFNKVYTEAEFMKFFSSHVKF